MLTSWPISLRTSAMRQSSSSTERSSVRSDTQESPSLRVTESEVGLTLSTSVFALTMGVITTGLISFFVLALNLGFSSSFPLQWLRANCRRSPPCGKRTF
ncbi:DUF2798 domain-containing protein [Phenylobacterium sp.]|uniref:DUF2798 domain-containing protein n=1 Tax=Phenylobacterium sp. TaxID=1871053 RepID=UPI00386210E0